MATDRLYDRNPYLGKPKKYTPAQIWKKAVEYFKWAEANPIKSEKAFHHQGEIVYSDEEHPRALTKQGLYLTLGIHTSTWTEWKKDEDYADVIDAVESIIFDQKLTLAAAGQLNARIISQELGLANKLALGDDEGGLAANITVEYIGPKE